MFIPFLPVKNRPLFSTFENPGISAVNPCFFKWGRQAMRVGLDCLNLPRDKSILMPASMCPAVLEPFINFGLKIDLYKLDASLHWDLNDILKRITSKTSAIYVIHYFGIAYDLRELRELCNDRGISLIEDCALAGFNPNSILGKTGDVSFFSLWKFHPITDGAMLFCNKNDDCLLGTGYPEPSTYDTARKSVKLKLKALAMAGLLPIAQLKRLKKNHPLTPDVAPEDNFGGDYPVFGISSKAKKLFLSENCVSLAKKRNNNFNILLDFALEKGIKPMYESIGKESVPYCFPIIVDDPVKMQNKLRQAGIETELSINRPFTNRPYLLPSHEVFPEILYLANHVLSIPIHQDIDEYHMEYIKTNLIEIA